MYTLSDFNPPVTPPTAQVSPAPAASSPGLSLPPTPYDDIIAKSEAQYGLPAGLLKATIAKESNFNPRAVSHAGAQGIAQFMPGTAKRFGIDPLDPAQAIPAAARYLKANYDMFNDWGHALAGYNWGEGNVQRMLKGEKLTPPAETRDYVRTIIGTLNAQRKDTAPAPAARGADIGISDDGRIYVNGQTFDSKDYGRAIELYRGGAFTSPGQGSVPPGFHVPPSGAVETYFQGIIPSTNAGKSFSAGVANYKAGWHEVLGAAKQLAGVAPQENTSIAAADRHKRYASQLGAVNQFPQTYDDAQGLGGVAQYTVGKILESAPYMVELIGPGLAGTVVRSAAMKGVRIASQEAMEAAGRAALARGATPEAAQAAAQRVAEETLSLGTRYAPQLAMVAAGMPSAMGDILGNQREQAGTYAPFSAAALAVPYAALNLLGGGAQIVRGLSGETMHGAISGMRGAPGRVVRGVGAAGVTGVEEAIGETGQEVLNQAGRIAVDPSASFTDPEALKRYRESAIAGGLVGGVLGGVGGAALSPRPADPVNLLAPPGAPTTPGAPAIPPSGPPAALPPSYIGMRESDMGAQGTESITGYPPTMPAGPSGAAGGNLSPTASGQYDPGAVWKLWDANTGQTIRESNVPSGRPADAITAPADAASTGAIIGPSGEVTTAAGRGKKGIDVSQGMKEQRARDKAYARRARQQKYKAPGTPEESDSQGEEAVEPTPVSAPSEEVDASTEQDVKDLGITEEVVKQIEKALPAKSKAEAPPRAAPSKPLTPAQIKKTHEALKTDPKLNQLLTRLEKLNRDVASPARYMVQGKKAAGIPPYSLPRAEARGGVDRIERDVRERANVIVGITKILDKHIKKHGISGLNAVFAMRKRMALEGTIRGPVTEAKKAQRAHDILLSTTWRLYRDGRFGEFGTSRGSAADIRTRIEEGRDPEVLRAWFAGERKIEGGKDGTPVKGMPALAYYMRRFGRTDLERMLGSRMYHIFTSMEADIDFMLVPGDHVEYRGVGGLQVSALGAYLSTGTSVVVDGKTITLDKPTIVLSRAGANEETLPHEMLHAATAHLIVHRPKIREQFMPIVNAIRKAKPKNPSPDLLSAWQAASSPQDYRAVAELVAYGFTSTQFQDYLKTVSMPKPENAVARTIRNAFEYFVNMIKLVTGAVGVKYSAMERLIEEGARLFDVAEATPLTRTPKGQVFSQSVPQEDIATAARYEDILFGKPETTSPYLTQQREQSRDKYNAIRERVGLEPITDWSKTPSRRVGAASVSPSDESFAQAVPTAMTAPAHANFLNPVTLVETLFRKVIEGALPFLYGKNTQGEAHIEAYLKSRGNELTKYIIQNHPTIARHVAGVVDKFGIPETFKPLLDMGRKKTHNAGQVAYTLWSSINGLPENEQKLVHDFIKADGNIDTSGLPENQVNLLNTLNATAKEIVDRAMEQSVLPASLKGVTLAELTKWIDGNSARLALGLKSSSSFTSWPKGYIQATKNKNIIGDGSVYHRGEVLLPDADPQASPQYVYIAEGTSVEDASREYGHEITLESDGRIWRPIKKKTSTTDMWAAIPYEEGKQKARATNYSDALVLTMHNLLHDAAVAEFANTVLSASDLNTRDSLVYNDRGALVEDVGEEMIIDRLDHPETKRLARTPGYWVRLGPGYGKLSGSYVPAPVHSAITDVADNSPLFPGYKRLLNFWKKTKTAYSPVTHFNNVMSSFIMMYMNDIPSSALLKAYDTYAKATRGTLKQRNGEALTADEAASITQWMEFELSGALVASYSSGEIGSTIADKIAEAIRREKHADTGRGLFRLLHKIEQTAVVSYAQGNIKALGEWAVKRYEMEDNIFRYAAFLEHMRRQRARGEAVDTGRAGKFAADAMINYSIDARYINNLRATVMPFLAWPYRMLPMLIRTALFKPWKLATIGTAIYGLNALAFAITGADEDEERKKLPEYMRGDLFWMPGAPKAIRLPGEIGGKPLFWNISNFMPLGDLAQESRAGLFGLAWPQAFMPTGPLVLAMELAMGYDSFANKPLHRPTDDHYDKTANVLKQAWIGVTPNLPLPYNRQGDKLSDLLREKHGITGSEGDWGTTILQMVGPKIVPVDLAEREAQAATAIAAIAHEYRMGIAKIARDEMRYANPDMEKIQEKQAKLVADMLEKFRKAKGEQ